MDLKALKELKENYEKALREKGQEIMKGAVEEFFEKNPKVKGVAWTQYTPYFNDGDTCTFGVNEPLFNFTEVDKENVSGHGDDGEGGFYDHYSFALYDLKDQYYSGQEWATAHNERVQAVMDETEINKSAFAAIVKSWQETVGAAPEDLFLAAFGDHVLVLLTPDEITVNEYSHD